MKRESNRGRVFRSAVAVALTLPFTGIGGVDGTIRASGPETSGSAGPHHGVVFLSLESSAHDGAVQPGEVIDWWVRARVVGNNQGLAALLFDLVQDPSNPAPVILPPADRAPAGMEAFERPDGFSHIVDSRSGYGGIPTETPTGGQDLRQVGGLQNTFDEPGPCLGASDRFCVGQSVDPVEGVGLHATGQIVASGSFPAPSTPGTYGLHLASTRALVLARIDPSDDRHVAAAARVDSRRRDLRIHVAGSEVPASEPRIENRMVRLDAATIRPPDGAVLSRVNVRFWWPRAAGVQTHRLELVEDDGSVDPFVSRPDFVMVRETPGDVTRLTITEGLEFGRAYAWRVTSRGRQITGVRRLHILPVPGDIPEIVVQRPQAGQPLQPGLTLFNLSNRTDPPEVAESTAIAVDVDGRVVYFLRKPMGDRGIGLIERRDNGRLLLIRGRTPEEGVGNGVFEETLDGRVAWASPMNRGYEPHHDADLMPEGEVVLLLRDRLELPEDNGVARRADYIVILDRHDFEETWKWHTKDHFSTSAGHPSPGRWTHGNAAFYSEALDSVFYSDRHFSRVTRIDHSTGNIIFNMGEDFPSDPTDFGDGFHSYQHDPDVLDGGNILLFDNGNQRQPLHTRVIEIELDDPISPSDASIVAAHELFDEDGRAVFAAFAGGVQRLDNGNTLVCAGAVGLIQEIGPGGDLLWNLRFSRGTLSAYRAQRLSSLIVDTPGDQDGDWDVDMADLMGLQQGMGHVALGRTLAFPHTLADMDGDADVDRDDLRALLNWLTEPVE